MPSFSTKPKIWRQEYHPHWPTTAVPFTSSSGKSKTSLDGYTIYYWLEDIFFTYLLECLVIQICSFSTSSCLVLIVNETNVIFFFLILQCKKKQIHPKEKESRWLESPLAFCCISWMTLRKITLTVTRRIHIQSEYVVTNPGNWKLPENKKNLAWEALMGESDLVSLHRCSSRGNTNYRFDFLYCINLLKSVQSDLFYIVTLHAPCIFPELIDSH